MKILYVDIYFLINFTVDLLSLFFAVKLLKLHTKTLRLVISSSILALYAVINELFDMAHFSVILSAAALFLAVYLCSTGVGFLRRLKATAAFLLFQILIGGCVYFGYCMLDGIFEGVDFSEEGGVNRKLLILSLLVLLAISVLKILSYIFSNSRSEKNIRVSVEWGKKECSFEALVDSGNLARDPLDGTAVMLVNEKLFEGIFGQRGIEKFDILSSDLRKRLRAVPVSTVKESRLLYGIKSEVYLITEKKKEKISIIIAPDKGASSYGGYPALIPLSVLEVL